MAGRHTPCARAATRCMKDQHGWKVRQHYERRSDKQRPRTSAALGFTHLATFMRCHISLALSCPKCRYGESLDTDRPSA